jgi:hypothetical protein
MLYRSLAKALYKDGRIVSETNEQENSNFYTNFGGITEDDTSTGYIYILKSKVQIHVSNHTIIFTKLVSPQQLLKNVLRMQKKSLLI